MNQRNQIGRLFGELVSRLLSARVPISTRLEAAINDSVCGLLSSAIIIEDSMSGFRPLAPINVRQALPNAPIYPAIEALLDEIARDGFVPHFGNLVGMLGGVLIANNATGEQQAQVAQWVADGRRGAFLMTDRGGATLDTWNSSVTIDELRHVLSLDKIWAMFAESFDFATVLVRKPGSMAPVTYLLGPEHCAGLVRAGQGTPYLGGTVPLGSVRGEVVVARDDILSQGGPLGVSRFLCQARPRFVLGVIGHVTWLARSCNVPIGEPVLADLAQLAVIARAIITENVLTRHSIDEVLALKFAVNEVLLSIVRSTDGLALDVQRDLLGLSKMEGSSYHCFAEIYGRSKGARLD